MFWLENGLSFNCEAANVVGVVGCLLQVLVLGLRHAKVLVAEFSAS